MLMAVSRAPLAKLAAYRQRMGWTFPWASSAGSDFNADFNIWFSEAQQRDGDVEYNYRREPKSAWGARPDATQIPAIFGTATPTFQRERQSVVWGKSVSLRV